MTSQRLLLVLLLAGLSLGGLSACGNKGDLFLIPDDLAEQDLDTIDDTLEAIGDTRSTAPAELPGTPLPDLETDQTDTDSRKPPRKPAEKTPINNDNQ